MMIPCYMTDIIDYYCYHKGWSLFQKNIFRKLKISKHYFSENYFFEKSIFQKIKNPKIQKILK